MKTLTRTAARRLAALALACLLAILPLAAQAAEPDAPGGQAEPGPMALDRAAMTLNITAYDPSPAGYLSVVRTESDYRSVRWSSSNIWVATVSSEGRVVAHNPGTATITARTTRGETATCALTVTQSASSGPALNQSRMNLAIQYNNLNPSQKLSLVNQEGGFVYVYQWSTTNPRVATVEDGVVTAHDTGRATITALTSMGQKLTCEVTVTSDVGRVVLSKTTLLMPELGSIESLTATVAAEGGDQMEITWLSSDPLVASVTPGGAVTALADGEATITALSPEGRAAACQVYVGAAAARRQSEQDFPSLLKTTGLLRAGG